MPICSNNIWLNLFFSFLSYFSLDIYSFSLFCFVSFLYHSFAEGKFTFIISKEDLRYWNFTSPLLELVVNNTSVVVVQEEIKCSTE